MWTSLFRCIGILILNIFYRDSATVQCRQVSLLHGILCILQVLILHKCIRLLDLNTLDAAVRLKVTLHIPLPNACHIKIHHKQGGAGANHALAVSILGLGILYMERPHATTDLAAVKLSDCPLCCSLAKHVYEAKARLHVNALNITVLLEHILDLCLWHVILVVTAVDGALRSAVRRAAAAPWVFASITLLIPSSAAPGALIPGPVTGWAATGWAATGWAVTPHTFFAFRIP
mmetsp:Transcript_17324/g.29610  ORF Transcript_17324/g.29610 Transcript_17324/m.29610 type:complete len:232 (-) Transcript_17324:122-817(-)